MKTPLSIDPSRAAAIFIDLQEEHRGDPRYVVSGFDAILAQCATLQEQARRLGLLVYHAAYVVDFTAGALRRFHPTTPDGQSAFSDSRNPLSEICAEVAPIEGERVFIKRDASVFSLEDTLTELHGRDIEWLFVAGVWSEACVWETVRDAIAHGFRVLLVKDACGSATFDMHRAAILNLANRLYGGAVVDTASARALMAGESAHVWQVTGSVPIRYHFEDAAELYASL